MTLGAGNAAIDFRPRASALGQTDAELLYGDAGYTGAQVDEASLTRFADLDYYRGKIREFQSQLNALAITADNMLALRDQVTNADLSAAIDDWLADFYSRKSALFLSAEAVNAAAQSANALGVRVPVLSIPQQLSALGLGPAVIAAIAAAVAGTAWAISYAVSKIADARALITRKETLELLPEDERAAALKTDQEIARAQSNAASGLGAVANVVKWLAIGAALFFGYKAFREFTAR